MAKKFLIFLCTFCLVFSFAFNAQAAIDKPTVGSSYVFNSFPDMVSRNNAGYKYFVVVYVDTVDKDYGLVMSKNPICFKSHTIYCGSDSYYMNYGYNGNYVWSRQYNCSNSNPWAGYVTLVFSSHNLVYGDESTWYTSQNSTYDLYCGEEKLTTYLADFVEASADGSGSDSGGDSSGGTVNVDMSKTNAILSSIKTALDDFKSNVVTLLESIKKSVDTGFENVKTYFSGVYARITSFNDSINSKLDEILENVRKDVDYNLNPNSDQLEGSFGESLQTNLNDKYTFINDFKSSLNNLNGDYGGIDISKTVNLGIFKIPIKINFDWYEPYRVKIKNIMAIFVYCLGGLACLRVILGVFDIYLSRVDTTVISDSTLEAGKSNVNYNVGSNASNPAIENNFNLLNK